MSSLDKWWPGFDSNKNFFLRSSSPDVWFSPPSLKPAFLNCTGLSLARLPYAMLILIWIFLNMFFSFRRQRMRCCSTSLLSFLWEHFWIIPLFLSSGLRSLHGQQDMRRWVTLNGCVTFLMWYSCKRSHVFHLEDGIFFRGWELVSTSKQKILLRSKTWQNKSCKGSHCLLASGFYYHNRFLIQF